MKRPLSQLVQARIQEGSRSPRIITLHDDNQYARWDEVDRQDSGQAGLSFMLGVGQGAIMALATAAAVSDLLSGVIAVDGRLPVVPGWTPLLAPLGGLPILVLDDPAREPVEGVLQGVELVKTLAAWGGDVRMEPLAGEGIPADAMSA